MNLISKYNIQTIRAYVGIRGNKKQTIMPKTVIVNSFFPQILNLL